MCTFNFVSLSLSLSFSLLIRPHSGFVHENLWKSFTVCGKLVLAFCRYIYAYVYKLNVSCTMVCVCVFLQIPYWFPCNRWASVVPKSFKEIFAQKWKTKVKSKKMSGARVEITAFAQWNGTVRYTDSHFVEEEEEDKKSVVKVHI